MKISFWLILVLLFSLSCEQNKRNMAVGSVTTKDSMQNNSIKDFREVNWGMTYSEVALKEIRLEAEESINENHLYCKTEIYAFGEKCKILYGFLPESNLQEITLRYFIHDRQFHLYNDGIFYNAFNRSRNIIKNLQDYFSYSKSVIANHPYSENVSCNLPITDRDILSIQNKMDSILSSTSRNINNTSCHFIVDFNNSRTNAQLLFSLHHDKVYQNDARFYYWINIEVELRPSRNIE